MSHHNRERRNPLGVYRKMTPERVEAWKKVGSMNNLILLKIAPKSTPYHLIVQTTQEVAERTIAAWSKGEFDGKVLTGTCPTGPMRVWAVRGDEIAAMHTHTPNAEERAQMAQWEQSVGPGRQVPFGIPPGASGVAGR